MKQNILIGILLSAFFFVNGQELKTKKVNDQFFTEIFQIDKKSKQKQGTYIKINSSNKDTLVCGQYQNGSSSGVWTYYHPNNKPYIKYNHSNDSCLLLSEHVNKPDTFPVRLGDKFDFAKLDRPPLYIGFSKELERLFASRIRIPVFMMERGESVTSIASFVVSKEGKLAEIQTGDIGDKQIRRQVIETFKEINGKWLPGIMAGNEVDTKFYLAISIGPNWGVKQLPEKPYVLYVTVRYFGVQKRVTVTGVVRSSGSGFGPSNMPLGRMNGR